VLNVFGELKSKPSMYCRQISVRSYARGRIDQVNANNTPASTPQARIE
jgi:hypothetical protein